MSEFIKSISELRELCCFENKIFAKMTEIVPMGYTKFVLNVVDKCKIY